VSVPNETGEDHAHSQTSTTKGVYASPNTKPLFKSLVGFALEVGDRLLLNDLEVVFKGWVDQSQTAIEVMAIADGAEIKQIRAKEIKSLARSQDISSKSTGQDSHVSHDFQDFQSSEDTKDSQGFDGEGGDQAPADNNHTQHDRKDADVETSPDPIAEDIPEIPKEPEYNAWEVWTYLERQRVKTLKLLNTFRAEWEANRFVREAERSAPSNLRVHYEIRPVCLDESEINGSYQNIHAPHPNTDEINPDAENYADVIDVEVIK
jgi:hypothetical protein